MHSENKIKNKFIYGYFGVFGGITILILVLPILFLTIAIGNTFSIIAVSTYTLIVIYTIARSISYVYYKGRIDGLKEGYELHYNQIEMINKDYLGRN